MRRMKCAPAGAADSVAGYGHRAIPPPLPGRWVYWDTVPVADADRLISAGPVGTEEGESTGQNVPF
jgi:hypothetical protein